MDEQDFDDLDLVVDGGQGAPDLVFDEQGVFNIAVERGLTGEATGAQAAVKWPGLLLSKACSLGTLNGSWQLSFTGRMWPVFRQLRGALRIETSASRVRVSGDMYRRELVGVELRTGAGGLAKVPPKALIIGRNWYPQFPRDEYAWYFRSTGVVYSGGVLTVPFERHLWSRTTQSFTSTDKGSLRLRCRQDLISQARLLFPPVTMTGEMIVGGETYPVEAVKTSPYYRGCQVEVDVMTNRNWPASAAHGPTTVSFANVYKAQGLDFNAVVNETNVPEQASLTVAGLHTLLTTHRGATGFTPWRLWLLVGSRLGSGNTYGLMFDDAAPHREGAVGFADATLPNETFVEEGVRGLALNTVPVAFLRTLIHEAGHAFNLYHPKHDVHAPPIGRTLMNQTGDVMDFASAADPYPGNAEFAFDDHSATSLIHSPDPQVAPGWRDFGWGHGDKWSGAAEPTDVGGLADEGSTADLGLRLDVRLPDRAVRGEIVVADVTVSNTGTAPRLVTNAINLSEGDLRLLVEQPNGDAVEVRDVVLACGPRRLLELQPGQSMTGSVQLFYTNQGFTFDQPGAYRLVAMLDVGDGSGEVLRSETARLSIDLPINEEERALADVTVHRDVGRAVAFGDSGGNAEVEERLQTCMGRYNDRDTGAVAAMVLSNSLSRPVVDLSTGSVTRAPDPQAASVALDVAVLGRSADDAVRLAVAAISPAEPDAPVMAAVTGTTQAAAAAGADEAGDLLRVGDRLMVLVRDV